MNLGWHIKVIGAFVVLLIMIFGLVVVPMILTENDVISSHTFVGASNELIAPAAIQIDDAGNIYIAGGIDSTANTSVFLLKYDSNGSFLWTDAWGGSNGTTYASGLALGPSGVLYVTGFTSAFGNGGGDLFLLKFHTNGSLAWARTWGGTLFDAGKSVAVDPLGNVYVVGTTDSYGSVQGEAAILKFDSSGALIWARIWGGANSSDGSGVVADSSGVYVAGAENSFGAGDYDALLLALNSTGSLIFERTWGGSGRDIANTIALDSSSKALYVAGSTDSYGVAGDAFILKFDALGNIVWQRTWGGNGTDRATGITVDSHGYIYVAGDTPSFGASNGTAFILELDSGGKIAYGDTWGKPYGKPCPEPCTSASSVAIDSFGYAYVAGSVRDGPPYNLGVGNSSLGIPNLSVKTPSFDALPANTVVRTPLGVVTHPKLNNTFTGGGIGGFFFKVSNGNIRVSTIAFSAVILLVLIVPIALLKGRSKRLPLR